MKKFNLPNINILLIVIALLFTTVCFADDVLVDNTSYNPVILLWLMLFIFLSRSLSIVKKIGLPLVVAEILAGIILGDLNAFGINLFQSVETNSIIHFLADFGAIILMFEIGLDAKFSDLKANAKIGSIVAITGATLTFIAGFLVSKFFIPNSNLKEDLLIGVITSATATGVSIKTLKDLGIMALQEAKIALVATIVDELVTIFFFAIISTVIISSVFNITHIALSLAQVFAFFIFATVFGYWVIPLIAKISTKISPGLNMQIGFLLMICFLFAWIAHKSGIPAVIGAFIAGLILDKIYFKSFKKSSLMLQLQSIVADIKDPQLQQQVINTLEKQEERELGNLLKPISHLFVPVFFIYIGIMLDIKTLCRLDTLALIAILVTIPFIIRAFSGYVLRNKNLNKLLIGVTMSPFGEAGLIFAVFGKNVGVIDDKTFSAIVASLVISSVLTPIAIKIATRYNKSNLHPPVVK